MNLPTKLIRTDDGVDRVLVDLKDFIALLDAARTVEHGAPAIGPIIERLEKALQQDEATVDLDDFLRQYDALHGPR